MSEPIRTQPQLAQLDLTFAAPLVKDSIVDMFTDLLFLNPKTNYQHKQVWVKEHKTNYYLAYGDGSEPNNWKKQNARVVIEKYDTMSSYQIDDTIFLSGKIFKALQQIEPGFSPLDYPNLWQCISGETETITYGFIKMDTVRVYTNIKNPKFEIITGDINFDNLGNPETDINGMLIIKNKRIVEGIITTPDNENPNNGIPYDIKFFKNSLPFKLTGIINVK